MADRLRVGVIFGGRSGEHEVSLMSAGSVLQVLDPQRYAVTQVGITPLGEWLVARPGSGLSVLQAFQDGGTGLSPEVEQAIWDHNISWRIIFAQ